MLHRAKPLQNNNSLADEGKTKKKAQIWSIHIRKEPYKNHSEKNRTPQNAKKNNKTTKKNSDRRRPS